MKDLQVPDGGDLYKEDLDFLVDLIEDETEQRSKYTVKSGYHGVLTGLSVSSIPPTIITVAAGKGITSEGHLIQLTSQINTSTSDANNDKYLCLLVTYSDDTSSNHAHPETGVTYAHYQQATASVSWLTSAQLSSQTNGYIKLCKQTAFDGVTGPTLDETLSTNRNEFSAKIASEAISSSEVDSIAASKISIANHAVVTGGMDDLEEHVSAGGSGSFSVTNPHKMKLTNLDSYKTDLAAWMGKCFGNGVFSPSGNAYKPKYDNVWSNRPQVEFEAPQGVERCMVSGKVFTTPSAYSGTFDDSDGTALDVSDRYLKTRFTAWAQSDSTQTAWYVGNITSPVTKYIYLDTDGILQCQDNAPNTGPVGGASYNTTKLFLSKITFIAPGDALDMDDFESSSVGAYGKGCDMRKPFMVTESIVGADVDEPDTADAISDDIPDYPTNSDQPTYKGKFYTLRELHSRIRNMAKRIVWGEDFSQHNWNDAFDSVTPNIIGLYQLIKKFSSTDTTGHQHTGVSGQGPKILGSNIIVTKPEGGYGYDYTENGVQDHVDHVGTATPTVRNAHGVSQYSIYQPTKVAEYYSGYEPYNGGTALGSLAEGKWIRYWFVCPPSEDLDFDSRNLAVDFDTADSRGSLVNEPPNLRPASGYTNFFSASQVGFRGNVMLWVRPSTGTGLYWVQIPTASAQIYINDFNSFTPTNDGYGPMIRKESDGLWSFTFQLPESAVGTTTWDTFVTAIGYGLGLDA